MEDLKQAVEAYVSHSGVQKAFDFGAYNRLQRTRAADGQGILMGAKFLSFFLKAVPSCEVRLWVTNIYAPSCTYV